MTTPTPDRDLKIKIGRMLDAVSDAIGSERPLLEDWRVDAGDVLTCLESAIERANHPDDHDRFVSVLSIFSGMWFTPDERDAIWLGDSS